MLTLHTSNRLEQLSQQFSDSIQTPLGDVLAPEVVVVQNSGMARYLSLQLADRQGISANMDFLFPAEFMWQLLKSILPNLSDEDPSAPAVTRWRLLELLLNEISADDKTFPELAHYINSTESAWDLSLVLTEMLDKILFYRDDWVRDWENHESALNNQPTQKWQARLWQKLFNGQQIDHWLSLQDQFVQAIHQPQNKNLLPQRVSFFSLSALSPGYIRLLGEMGKVMEINLFIVNPCPEAYWGDIESEKSISKKPIEEQPYFDSGNALLASMGRQGRDFIDQLQNLDECHFEENNFEQAPNSLLTQIQQDIFNLTPAQHNIECSKDDNSIQFHACHTAMREVEVLHDQLLNCLQNNPELAPSDIIVMTPDIEKYAAYVDAVFSAHSQSQTNSTNKKHLKLPFSIADQNPAHAQPTIEAFLKILDLIDKRFDAESVFELLDYDSIRDKFELTQDDVLFCREIARSTNIRWGISAKTRKNNNLPDTKEHTWRYAFDRLLLGYTLAGDDLFIADPSKPLDDLPVLPFSDIEGNQAQTISRFIQFTNCLFKLETFTAHEQSLDKWLDLFNQFIRSLFADESQNRLLFNALDKLRQQTKLAEFSQGNASQNDSSPQDNPPPAITLPFSLIGKILKQSLTEISGNESFMGYGITFCALVPMRSVPFKVVALLGMNDGEYPRQDRSMSFDLVAQTPRKGDRSRRNEDRYLFLESVLAAREKLIISYIGQSVKDNTSVPPSTLVSELLDEVCIYTNSETQDWICKHPLQAFSQHYFDNSDARLFSYNTAYTKIKNTKKVPSQVFINQPLENLSDDKKQLHLSELIRFYQSPARVFLKERFSISNFDKELVLPIREPFEIEAFKDRDIRQEIFDKTYLKAHAIEDCTEESLHHNTLLNLRAKGLLPYGDIGEQLYEREFNTIQHYIKQLPEPDDLPNQPFKLEFNDNFTLQGELTNLSPAGRMIQQVSTAYAGDYINLWLNHLALNAVQTNNTTQTNSTPAETRFYSPELNFKLNKVGNAHHILQQLIDYYWQGLHYPLHFYAKPAFKQYVNKKENSGVSEALKAWDNSHFGNSEAQKFEHWLLYRAYSNDELFNDEYEAISELIMGGLFAHYEAT